MSYAFDVMSRVWSKHIRNFVPNEEIKMRFEMLFESMHDANHEVSYDVFKGDGLNKHPVVTRRARELDDAVKRLEEESDGSDNESGQRQAPDDPQR